MYSGLAQLLIGYTLRNETVVQLSVHVSPVTVLMTKNKPKKTSTMCGKK